MNTEQTSPQDTATPLETTQPVVVNTRKFILKSVNKPLPVVTPLTKAQRIRTGQIVPLDMEQIMLESEAIGEKYFNALRSTHSEKFD